MVSKKKASLVNNFWKIWNMSMQNLFQNQSHQIRNDDGRWNGTHSCGKTEKKLTIQFLFGSDANAAESHEYWHFILTKNVVIFSYVGWMITKLKTGGVPLCERSCRPGGAGSIFGPWPSQNPGLIHCKERGVKDPITNTGKKSSQILTRGLSGIPMQLAKLSPHADCTQERHVRELRSNRLCSNTMGSEWHSQNEMGSPPQNTDCFKMFGVCCLSQNDC